MTDPIIRSRTNPLVKRLRALKERAAGDGSRPARGVHAGGGGPGRRASDRGGGAHARAPRHRARGASSSQQLERRAACPCACVDEAVLDSLSETETSQGLLALAAAPGVRRGAGLRRPGRSIVVAGGLQNPGNVGALLRAAEAAGATGAYFTRGSADPLSWKALRGAMGSAFRAAPRARAGRRRGAGAPAAPRRGHPGRRPDGGDRYDARRPDGARSRSCSGRRRAGCAADLAAQAPTAGSRSRWPDAPRASTSPWPRACSSSRPPGSARAGLRAG